ncbi:multiple sugar transport system substrate-binding protein [Lipingzhangella halophila]|uniref:Multiple sugar transport system substrate-binding protein n=1 Tax=Lipingzhangella halophila TaxID=1783352 RepID=A0A7W7RL84_9ACTN|nr:extracellular solute-binding protein [Lipingzhangella halophila]MBB4933996.1 multiple sugar transport system substrate-binding protein [Lipingzhangella halophila]
MRRGRFLPALAGLVVGGCLAAGCSVPDDDRELVLATPLDPRTPEDQSEGIYHQLLDSALAEWQENNPGWDVRLVHLSGNADHQRAQFAAIAQSEGEVYDVVSLDTQWVAEFAEKEWITPISGISADGGQFEPDNFLDEWIEAVTYQEEVWAAPFLADVGLLYYRADLVDHADLENAFSEDDAAGALLDLADDAAGGGIDGYAGQFANYEGLTVNVLELDWASGRVDDEALFPTSGGSCQPENVNLGTEVVGIEHLRRHMATGTIPSDAVHDDELTSLRRFNDGEVAFLRHWPYAEHVLDQSGAGETGQDEEVPGLEFAGWLPEERQDEASFGMSPWPGGGALGGQSLAVASESRAPEEARELVELLVDSERQRLLQEAGFAPTLEEAYGAPGTENLKAALDRARPRPCTPYYPRVSQVLSDAVHGGLDSTTPYSPDGDELRERLDDALAGR